MDNSILVIDDEQSFLDSVRRGLITSGFENVQLESDPGEAVALFKKGEAFDIALIDIAMPGTSGVELLESIKAISPATECIMVTAVDDARIAVECLKKGAYDYLVKPISKDNLASAINRALERKRLLDVLDLGKKKILPRLIRPEAFKSMITRSVRMLRIFKEAELHAGSNVPVLITGESGTGKELLAIAIHAASPRAKFPFVPLNMASLTGSLFDAEFFGHTRGAFTGAKKERKGYLEHANHGTLFLDEIGGLPLNLQGKLLRVLQEGEYARLGTSKPQKVDIRFIAATNVDPDRLMAKAMFRKDLYYRLRGAWLRLPPLRERKEDIPLLTKEFLGEFCGVSGPSGIEEEAMSVLMDYDYHGNIRELRSILQSAVNLARGRPISANQFPDYLQRRKPISRHDTQAVFEPLTPLSEVEKAHILKVYAWTGRNKAQAARVLGIGLNTLRRRLRSYGVD